MLTNFRYFGYINNPITCYYCYDEHDELAYMVAEVTNTPWGERHAYVIPCTDANGFIRTEFDKDHHVSPFMPMQMQYCWRSNIPRDNIRLLIDASRFGEKYFSAGLLLKRKALNPANLNRVMWLYPFMTLKVVAGIYWQALLLWLKKVPFYPHPKLQKKPEKEIENTVS